MVEILKKYKSEIILCLLILAYIILFSYLSIRRLLTFQSHYFDLGIMNQVVYNTSRGWFLEMTNQDFVRNISRLAIHFDPVLAFFAPVYYFYRGPEALLIAQTIILALGAVAVYLIANVIIGKKIYGLLFALSYLLYFPVERANLFDFHAVTLATTFLLFAIYWVLIRKYKLSLLFIILSLLTKEHVGLVTFCFGVYLFLFKKERKFSLIVIFLSLLFFVATVFFIIPSFRQEGHFALKRYGDFGETPGKIILGSFLHPEVTFKYLLRQDSLEYLIRLLGPYFVFLIFAPVEFFISLPEMMINLLSANANMKAIYFHYNSLIVPFILYSAIVGFKRVTELVFLKKKTWILIILFITFNAFNIYRLNPLPFNFLKEPFWWGKINEKKLEMIKTWQQTLKDDQIKVASTPQIAPFFSSRRYYYNFLFDPAYPNMGLTDNDIIKTISDYREADYVIINKSEIGNVEGTLMTKFYQHLKQNTFFIKIFEKEEIEVYKKNNN